MQTATFPGKKLIPLFFSVLILFFFMLIQGCKKTWDLKPTGENSAKGGGKGNPHNPPPPPPPAPYFSDCYNPLYSATFTKGVPATVTIIKNYVYSTGGSYPAFTSSTVNGITVTAPAGTLNVGSGSVVFTATGTPVTTGLYNTVTIGVGGMNCVMYFKVLNAPPDPATCGGDPGTTPGSTGCVTFNYRGQTVTYSTVRAKDGRIWLQQNLGSPQVAIHEMDNDSHGDYFQWGRWDDGHQLRTSPVITGSPSLSNPSHIPSGNPNFISGTTAGTKWWGVGGLATDTWSGTTATSTNGKDPCVVLGTGWRLPTAAEWQNVANYEDLFGNIGAFQSNLKLTSSGQRWYQNGDAGYYWTSNAADNSYAKFFFFDANYTAGIQSWDRAEGFPCRCIRD